MSNNTFYDAIKKRKPSAQELYYMQLLGRPLTPDEMSFPSTITKNDKGVPIIPFQNWVKQGGAPDSLLKRYGYLPECSEKQSQSHASKTRKSDKPFENKYSKEANPDALWLSCRLRRKLEGHEVLYARQVNEDDQGRPINWPSPERVKQMFFPDPPKKNTSRFPVSFKAHLKIKCTIKQTHPDPVLKSTFHPSRFGNLRQQTFDY